MVGELIGATGVAIALGREWAAVRERRRARPVVIVHEERGRHFRDDGGVAVLVWLSNESSASAFNVRFEVEFGDVAIPFRHPQDEEPARVNVIRPGQRYPESGVIEIRLPDALGFVGGGDPDPGRAYRAEYQSPSGEWWSTRNPWARTADFTVTRRRLPRRKRDQIARRSANQIEEGERRLQEGLRELLRGRRGP